MEPVHWLDLREQVECRLGGSYLQLAMVLRIVLVPTHTIGLLEHTGVVLVSSGCLGGVIWVPYPGSPTHEEGLIREVSLYTMILGQECPSGVKTEASSFSVVPGSSSSSVQCCCVVGREQNMQ